MHSKAAFRARLLASIAAVLCLLAASRAQIPAPPATPPPDEEDEVVRVSSELVQTDVMVFNQRGEFVDGLKPEQFELKVDGRAQPIAFFERVEAGAVDEDAQLAAARGGVRPATRPAGAPVPLDRGRTVIFFVDDLHLSPSSAQRARASLLRFIEEEMGQNDEAAVASASGQIGFLQQFTQDRTVLRAAVARIQPRPAARDGQTPPMNEANAFSINREDSAVISYFVDAMLRENRLMTRATAENSVRARAREIVQYSQHLTSNTLQSLGSLVRFSAPLPGRKLLFFISDGFVVDPREGTTRDLLRRITDAAARAGVVIYTMDPAGLRTGVPGAGDAVAFDPSGRLAGSDFGDLRSRQEPLRSLAADTGGRALINTNALGPAVEGALKETARYYLLAWRPAEGEQGGASKFRRIEVSVRGREDLSVMVRRGLYAADAPPEAEARGRRKRDDEKNAARPAALSEAERELRAALGAVRPVSSLPAALSVGFVEAPGQGAAATITVGLSPEAVALLDARAGEGARLDLLAVIYDDRGQVVNGFRGEAGAAPRAEGEAPREQLVESRQFGLAPGLYQVRAAVRDRQTRRVGSAVEWVEIPDFKRGQFTLSSLFLAERTTAGAADTLKPEQLSEGVSSSVGRRFARGSWMRFVTFIHNAAKGTSTAPDVALQIQVFRDDQPVLTAPLAKVNTDAAPDLARILYAAELPLRQFPPGRYVLQLTAIDRTAKVTAQRRVNFTVE